MMLEDFIREEKAQAGFEYVLLIGIVIIQTVLIGSVYMRIVRSSGERILKLTESYSEKLSGELFKEIEIWERGMRSN